MAAVQHEGAVRQLKDRMLKVGGWEVNPLVLPGKVRVLFSSHSPFSSLYDQELEDAVEKERVSGQGRLREASER